MCAGAEERYSDLACPDLPRAVVRGRDHAREVRGDVDGKDLARVARERAERLPRGTARRVHAPQLDRVVK